jgi:hypothetical protein
VFRYLILFCAAAAATLVVFFFLRKRGEGSLIPVVSLLPLTAPFSLAGSPGFALSALFLALLCLLLAPLRELFASRGYGYKPFSLRARRIQWGSYRVSWGMTLVLICAYGGICFFGGLSPVTGAGGLVFFLISLGAVLRAESNRGKTQDHIRFLPVPIVSPRGGMSRFFRIILPFATASLAALFTDPLLGFPDGPAASPAGFWGASGETGAEDSGAGLPGADSLIGAGEYYAHFAFQSAFSQRPLRTGDPGDRTGSPADPEESYLRYVLGDDGLITGSRPVADAGPEEGIPPFPLEDLMLFLGSPGTYARPVPRAADALPALIALIPGLCSLFRIGTKYRKKGAFLAYHDKRIAA